MTIQHIYLAINDSDNGRVNFNLRELHAFLYRQKWYPLRAVINHASGLAGGPTNLTTEQALMSLVHLGAWTRIEKIDFTSHFPVNIDGMEIMNEISKLSNALFYLSN